MNQIEHKIVDNVIYTSDVDVKLDPKGVGHYYYSKMIDNRNKIAQIDGCTKEEETFGSLLQRSVRTALAMIEKGVKPGDHISLCTYNHLNSAVPYIASYFTGTIMGPIEPTMSVEEAAYLLRKTLPKIIFATPTAVPLVEKVIESIGTDTIIVVFGETSNHIPFSQLILPHEDEDEFKPYEPENLNELSLILFSSGTSGMPKAICFNHVNMLSVNNQNIAGQGIVLYTIANPYWSVFPIFLHLSVELGSTRVVYPFFNNEEPWTMFYQHVDFGFLNSTQALRMVQSPKPDKINLKNVKAISLGGNPLTLNQLNLIESTLSHTMVRYSYSQTELFKRCFNPVPYGSELHKNNKLSVGTIQKGFNYKVVDVETEKVLGPNQLGELRLKSPCQFIGYLNDDSSERFDSDDFLRTGDLFYYNEDLCFYIVGRVGESFKFQIHHISPQEIERVILDLEPVEAAVVLGLPHETEYHHPMAVVKLKSNARKISAEEIIKYVESKLENKKWLRGGVKFVDTFPMTVTGKVNRMRLKKLVLGKVTSVP